jgi:hypothetical protein
MKKDIKKVPALRFPEFDQEFGMLIEELII